MSKTVKFTISDQDYEELSLRAESSSLSIQDYIRKELFNIDNLFTAQDAINIALEKYTKGDKFTVPEIYGRGWNLPNGIAGQFGIQFLKLVETEYYGKIRRTNELKKGLAVYEII